jgi:hypothetical protein
VRKLATNCPFKLTYTKSVTDPFYRLQSDYRSYHNHAVPVASEYGPRRKTKEEEDTPSAAPGEKTAQQIQKEQEEILNKLMNATHKKPAARHESETNSAVVV